MVSDEHKIWLMKLLGYDFKIHYRLSLENHFANALSCVEIALTLTTLLVPHILQLEELQNQADRDEFLVHIMRKILKGSTSDQGFQVV